jgi:hypothetical protein
MNRAKGAASQAKQRLSRSKTAAHSGTSKTGLMNFTLRNKGVKSVKKKKLFERSEFFFFSSTFPYFSKIRAALIFCFFCIKAKEKASCNQAKRKGSLSKKHVTC